MANAIILCLPEKNALPTDLPIEEGMSPIGELLRIDQGVARKGFDFYGSRGNPVINGFVSPDAKSWKTTYQSAAEGATFESAQTVANKSNFVMQQLCEHDQPVAVFLLGHVLPQSAHDSALKDSEQSVYMGTYQVRWCEQEEPLQPTNLVKMKTF
jgi:hypothetical protein